MNVKCKFCTHEKNGLCTKKLRDGNPTAVKVNKKRTCKVYSEDALRVLSDYRKSEQHKRVIQNQVRQRAQVDQVIKEMREPTSKTKLEVK